VAEASTMRCARRSLQKMVTPAAKREAVAHLCSAFEVSERGAGVFGARNGPQPSFLSRPATMQHPFAALEREGLYLRLGDEVSGFWDKPEALGSYAAASKNGACIVRFADPCDPRAARAMIPAQWKVTPLRTQCNHVKSMIATICSCVKRALRIAPSESGASLSRNW
jgi:hypothetical protein